MRRFRVVVDSALACLQSGHGSGQQTLGGPARPGG